MSRVAREIVENAVSALRIDEVSASLTYIGDAETGTAATAAKWRVKKIEKTGTETVVTWADGNDKHDNVWDNRVSLTYL